MSMERVFMCQVCNSPFTKKRNLERHLNTNCSLIKNKSEFIFESDVIKCKFCHKIFAKSYRLDRHLKSIQGDCFKLRNHVPTDSITINNNQKIINKNYNKTINNQTINNQTFNQIAIQPIIVLAKHGEETISHITKEVMLGLLDTKSFTGMCTELMRLLYFNDEVPENQNWTIVYPKNKKAGLQLNKETNKFERVETYNIIDDKFDNMIELLLPLIEEIEEEDKIKKNLNEDQRKNILRFGRHYKMEISKESEEIYESVKEMAYNERKRSMATWKKKGHEGNHLSLKF